jgi:hypothetical protein
MRVTELKGQRHEIFDFRFFPQAPKYTIKAISKFFQKFAEKCANLPPVSLIPWCSLICKYLCDFQKKIEITLVLFSGAWGKMIHEKNLKQKIS